jgi:anti-anti-sigma factor
VPEGNILFARKDNVCFVRLTGTIKHTISARFERLIQDTTSDKRIDDIVLDVNQAKYIDSTNLGLMAMIARYMLGTHHRKPVILCENPDIGIVLRSMGFGSVFEIVSKSVSDRLDFETAPDIEQTHKERIHTILDAHRVLMEMNSHNCAAFKSVVEVLEDRLGSGMGRSS